MKGYISPDKQKHFFMHESFSSVIGSYNNATNHLNDKLHLTHALPTVNNWSTAEAMLVNSEWSKATFFVIVAKHFNNDII